MDNALDAVGQGGRVRVSSRADGAWLTVRVRDSGPGVAGPILPAASSILSSPPRIPGQGTGLGLSISHSITQRLGGSLELENHPGQGATFVVRPAQYAARNAVNLGSGERSMSPFKVLVVDDERDFLESLVRRLQTALGGTPPE